MKKIEYHLNDYVINEDNKICKVVGTRLEPCADYTEQPKQMLTIIWWEEKEGKSVSFVKEVPAIKVIGWSFTLAVLERIGFKRGKSATMVVYKDPDERRTIILDRSDGSIYVYKHSRHVMLDFTFVDYVHDIQHVFETAKIEFPDLSGWLYPGTKRESRL